MLSQIPDNRIEEDILRSYPYDSLLGWNIKDFDPLYIPGIGDQIEMNPYHYRLYRKLIEWEQGGKLVLTDTSILLNGEPITFYTFTHDYYFVGGDRVEDSQDSRYWGLLPEEYIVGKAFLVWMSVDVYSGEYEWKRFLKRIL